MFLASRDRHDLERNSLVAVFLRVLEYYRGILFLTTNRVGTFDEAFRSRIHMWLFYPALTKNQTIAIWEMNLRRLQERRRGEIIANWEELRRFAEDHFDRNCGFDTCWNGRQIRNAYQTAVALAEYDANKELETDTSDSKPLTLDLSVKYSARVAKASLELDRYIQKTVGNRSANEVARLKQEQTEQVPLQEESFQNRDTGESFCLRLPSTRLNSNSLTRPDSRLYGCRIRIHMAFEVSRFMLVILREQLHPHQLRSVEVVLVYIIHQLQICTAPRVVSRSKKCIGGNNRWLVVSWIIHQYLDYVQMQVPLSKDH